MFGRGYGIVPVGNVIYAPANGRIAATTVSNHSIGLRTDNGIELIIHVGIDTVKMEGKGFSRLVESEQEVKAGQPILVFDDDAIKAAGYDDVVTVIVTSPSLLDKVKLVGQSNTLFADHPLVNTVTRSWSSRPNDVRGAQGLLVHSYRLGAPLPYGYGGAPFMRING